MVKLKIMCWNINSGSDLDGKAEYNSANSPDSVMLNEVVPRRWPLETKNQNQTTRLCENTSITHSVFLNAVMLGIWGTFL